MNTRSSSLAAAFAMACATAAAAQSAPIFVPGALKPHQQLAREIYQELIEINTGVTTGNVTPAAVAMAKRFKAAGIPDSDIFVGGPRPDKHNVVARIRGRSSGRKPVILLAHIDVVEALKADWSADLDPFVFTERDGYYYGRGTADDKAMASIFVANAFRLKGEGYVPDRDIIIALTEGGGGTLRNGKPLFNTVQATEKITTNLTLHVTNRGGHSSVPRADNAIYSLAQALGKVSTYRFPIKLNDVTRQFFSKTAEPEEPTMGRAMKALVANPADQSAMAVVTADPRYNSMLRTTCVATGLSGGHATNALPQLAEANINCRIYPDETAQQVRGALARAIGDSVVEVLVRTQRPPSPPSPLLPEVMQPVERITRELFGNILVIPVMSTGATDSRFFRQQGYRRSGCRGCFSTRAWTRGPMDGTSGCGSSRTTRGRSFCTG